ncbi:MAG: amidohydrolase family protein [Eubacteriales bacterium]|nr:amidohydrolase family protein [Clostridiales bacterium]MDY5836681.1 amidohydrolase family protein [Eubacteriales bacterium]
MLVIKNAQVFRAAGPGHKRHHQDLAAYTEKDCEILIQDGKFAQIGENLSASLGADVPVFDAQGLFLMPGIVDAHSHIGGFGDSLEDQDLNEMTNPATPDLEALYSINPDSFDFDRALSAGITSSILTPGSGNVVCGLVCAFKSQGQSLQSRCIKNPVALKMALGGNPKGVYGDRKQRPMTRMGIAAVIRDCLKKGQEYLEKKAKAQEGKGEAPAFDQALENIGRVLRREIPIKVHCEQFDMLTTLRIAEEFDIMCTLDHAWGASDFYEEICGSKHLHGVIYGPIGVPLLPGECGKIDIDSLAVLDQRGVTCAIMTDGPILHPDQIVTQAGEAVRLGTPHESVLRMLTIQAAQIGLIADRVGSIEEGKDADLCLYQGIPGLDADAHCVRTMVDGKWVYIR